MIKAGMTLRIYYRDFGGDLVTLEQAIVEVPYGNHYGDTDRELCLNVMRKGFAGLNIHDDWICIPPHNIYMMEDIEDDD